MPGVPRVSRTCRWRAERYFTLMFETVNRNIAMPDAAIGAAVILAVPDELDVGRMGRLRATTGQWEDRGAVGGSLTRRRQLIPRYCRSERISATEELGQFPPPALQNRSGPVTPDFYAIAIVTIISHFRTLAPQRNCGIDFLSITQISLVPMRWLPKHLRRSRLGRLRPGGKPGCHHDELVVEKKFHIQIIRALLVGEGLDNRTTAKSRARSRNAGKSSGSRPRRDRPGVDAARTPYPGRHLGTLRDRARCARLVCRDPDNRDLCILVAAALTWAAHSSVATTCVAPDIFATAPKYASMAPNKNRDQPACFCIDRLWLRSVST